MKFLQIAIPLLFVALVTHAQIKKSNDRPRPDSVGYYMLSDTEVAYGKADAAFIRLLIKVDSGAFKVNDYYMNGRLRLATLTTLDSSEFQAGAQGICYEYFDNGKRKAIKHFNNGKLVDDLISYYPNGNLKSIESYSANGAYLKQCLDSTGKTLAENGNGKWLKFSDDFSSRLEGNVVEGKEDGDWKRYIADTILTISYQKGKITKGKEFLAVDANEFTKFDIPPTFPGGNRALGQYLGTHINYPIAARNKNVMGDVTLSFVVEKDGSVKDVKIVKGIGAGCDEEAARVMTHSPKWIPALSKGKSVRAAFSIPVSFRLSDNPF